MGISNKILSLFSEKMNNFWRSFVAKKTLFAPKCSKKKLNKLNVLFEMPVVAPLPSNLFLLLDHIPY